MIITKKISVEDTQKKMRKSSEHVTTLQKKNNKTQIKGFPGGAVAESLPAGAGDTGSIPGPDPWSGKIPHATEQMGP